MRRATNTLAAGRPAHVACRQGSPSAPAGRHAASVGRAFVPAVALVLLATSLGVGWTAHYARSAGGVITLFVTGVLAIALGTAAVCRLSKRELQAPGAGGKADLDRLALHVERSTDHVRMFAQFLENVLSNSSDLRYI